MKVSIDNQILIVLRVSIVDVIKYNVIHKLKIKIIYVPRTQVMYLEYHWEHVYMHEGNSTNSEKQRVHISFS